MCTRFVTASLVRRPETRGWGRIPLKDTAPAEIVNAVRLVAAGEAMLSPSITRTLLSHLGNDEMTDRRRSAAQRLSSLTDREREVAAAVGSGASNATRVAVSGNP